MTLRSALDALLAAAAISSAILLLGAVFLLILRTPKFQFSLRFLLLTIGSVAVVLGLWTVVLRGIGGRAIAPPDPPQATPVEPARKVPLDAIPLIGTDKWTEPMDGPYEPQPLHPPATTPDGNR